MRSFFLTGSCLQAQGIDWLLSVLKQTRLTLIGFFFQRVTVRHFILTNVSTCWALHLLVPVLKSLGFSVMFKHVYASVFDSKVLVMLSVKKATG